MLSKAVIAAYGGPVVSSTQGRRMFVTRVSPCPYATYLNFCHLDDQDFSAGSQLMMKNGHWQELEILEDLRKAGFPLRYVGNEQKTVHVGKALIPGRPDGLITVSREDLLEIKAMNYRMYANFKQRGLETFPGYRCQVQLYLASEELRGKVDGCWFYVKHRDSCMPHDIFLERDEAYSKPIIEFVDEIVLGGVEVSRPKETTPVCPYCRHQSYCWDTDVLDMSSIGAVTKSEVVKMWLEGQFHLQTGKQLNEDSRVLLKDLLGSNSTLLVEGEDTNLVVKKIIQERLGISETKFVEMYGAMALAGVMEEKTVEQFRVRIRD